MQRQVFYYTGFSGSRILPATRQPGEDSQEKTAFITHHGLYQGNAFLSYECSCRISK